MVDGCSDYGNCDDDGYDNDPNIAKVLALSNARTF